MTTMIEPASYPPPDAMGVYRFHTRHGGTWYRKWNGVNWMAGDNTTEGAMRSQAVCRSPNVFNEPWGPA